MQKLTVFCALVVATGLTASCSDTDVRVATTEPTPVRVVQTGLSVDPAVVFAQRVANPFCPAVPPFTAVLNVRVRGDAAVNLFINTIRLRFVDTFGAQLPQITLPAPVLTAQFGSALVQARDVRTFPIPFVFGCGTQRTGTVTVFVDMRDDRGAMRSQQTTATVH